MLPIKQTMQKTKQWHQFMIIIFCIPLDFEILESSLPLYQYGLGSRLTYELTFADLSDVIKATNPDATYTISTISLEFDTVTNASLASQIRTEYMKSSILYDRILRARIIPPGAVKSLKYLSAMCVTKVRFFGEKTGRAVSQNPGSLQDPKLRNSCLSL